MAKDELNTILKDLDSEMLHAKPANSKSNNMQDSDFSAIRKHQEAYSSYLEAFVEDYREKSKKQRRMKAVFFWVTLGLLFIIITGGVAAFAVILAKERIEIEDVAAAIAAAAGAVSSFVVLPKVIAENLFPSKEENQSVEIFQTMLESDRSLRDQYSALPTDSASPTKVSADEAWK